MGKSTRNRKKPTGRRLPESPDRRLPERTGSAPTERAGRADHRAGKHAGEAQPFDKVAPWEDWKRVRLRASSSPGAGPVQFTVSGLGPWLDARYSKLITRAADKHFKIKEPPRKDEGPAAYLVDGRLRVVYKELVIQFQPRVPTTRCRAIIKENRFSVVKTSRLVENKWIVRPDDPDVSGESLLVAADKFEEIEDVRFAWPNSVSEYVRADNSAPVGRDWWLEKLGVTSPSGGRILPPGDAGVRIAVLDDGVDIDHPNLLGRVDEGLSRDYALADNEAGHHDPRPKVQVFASDEPSDYHGTACAGIILSDASLQSFAGVAPGCTLVAVRVIDGADLVLDERVAEGINYARGVADVISCSWHGAEHTSVTEALNHTIDGRGGKGVAVFGAAGNDGTVVDFPARHARVIAVGACDYQDRRPDYANTGNDLDVVAPTSGSNVKVFTTDVAKTGWGFNTATSPLGLFYEGFGKTSAATAMAAGVGALCFSAKPSLTADQLRSVLQDSAVKIAPTSAIVYVAGHHPQFGYGRIDAYGAVQMAKHI